jgi:hypothetical protein
MRKITLNFVMLLLALVGFMSGCSQKEEIIPQNAGGRNENGGLKTTSSVTFQVKRYIFQRPNGANGLGHVGVGFEVRRFSNGALSNVTYYYGGVENSSASLRVPRNGNNGGWWRTTTSGATMLNTMKNAPYNYVNYKFTANFASATSTNVVNGTNKIADFPFRGYFLAGNNCMNATYDVLTSMGLTGASVAWPSTNYFPNGWYNATTNGWSTSRAL